VGRSCVCGADSWVGRWPLLIVFALALTIRLAWVATPAPTLVWAPRRHHQLRRQPEANASAFRDGWYWSGDLGHPKVRQVGVVGTPSGHGDDLVRAVIVTDVPCTAEEIVVHCAGRIADYKTPSRIEFRATLPKSETGKLLRHEL
jgi:AMP-binding enzyme C-terminal domain